MVYGVSLLIIPEGTAQGSSHLRHNDALQNSISDLIFFIRVAKSGGGTLTMQTCPCRGEKSLDFTMPL